MKKAIDKKAALVYTVIVPREQEREERKMSNMIPNAMTYVTLGNSNTGLPTWAGIALIALVVSMVGVLVYVVIKEMVGR